MRLDVVDVEGQLDAPASWFCTGVVLLEEHLMPESFPTLGVVPLPDVSIGAGAFFLEAMFGAES